MTDQQVGLDELIYILACLKNENWNQVYPWINTPFSDKSGSRYFLLWLIDHGHIMEAVRLVDKFSDEIDFNQTDTEENNALHRITTKKYSQEIFLLLQQILNIDRINLNHQNKKKQTALYGFLYRKLSDQDDFVIEEFLIKSGINLELTDNNHMRALDCACHYTKQLKIIQLLLSYGSDVNHIISKDAQTWTPLSLLLIPNDQMIKSLIENPDLPFIVEELLNAGADPNIPLTHIPICVASKYSRICSNQTIEILLEYGAEINITDQIHGSSALMYAVQESNSLSSFETVQLLVQNGARINQINVKHKYIPIFYAVKDYNRSNFETIQFLIENGADLTFQNERGQTPLAYLLASEDNISIKLLQYIYQKSPPKVFTLKTNKGNTIQSLIKLNRSTRIQNVHDAFFASLDNKSDEIQINFEQSECTFCLDTMSINTCQTRCGHRFHVKCLSTYLDKTDNPVCPICRAPC